MVADVARDAVAGDAADARADDLDADHQRRGQEHAPQHAEAELRAGLRVGGDAARVVVGRAGDEPGAEAIEEFARALRSSVSPGAKRPLRRARSIAALSRVPAGGTVLIRAAACFTLRIFRRRRAAAPRPSLPCDLPVPLRSCSATSRCRPSIWRSLVPTVIGDSARYSIARCCVTRFAGTRATTSAAPATRCSSRSTARKRHCGRRSTRNAHWPIMRGWTRDPLRVRMGLHTCEATSVDDDYVGIGVHRASRICDAGHGGQVLLSHTTRARRREPRIRAARSRRACAERACRSRSASTNSAPAPARQLSRAANGGETRAEPAGATDADRRTRARRRRDLRGAC